MATSRMGGKILDFLVIDSVSPPVKSWTTPRLAPEIHLEILAPAILPTMGHFFTCLLPLQACSSISPDSLHSRLCLPIPSHFSIVL